MQKVNLHDLPWLEWKSPRGQFHGFGRQVSEALGAVPGAHLGAGGHPFDLELGRLPPGKAGCPFHSHSAQWECFIILSGRGLVRHGADRREVTAGDIALHPPHEPHQLINLGDTDLTYFLVADNPPTEYYRYPDSAKFGFKPHGTIFTLTPIGYHDGEEPGTVEPPRPLPPPPAGLARFARLADLPWDRRHSPKGKYDSHCCDVSLALGGIRDIGLWAGGHPFDLQLRRVPPGAAICPYHRHTLQWELFIVDRGEATVRCDGETTPVGPGEVFLQKPGVAHQITNTGSDDFVTWIIADHHAADSTYYPDSDKWQLKPQRQVVRLIETDYFDGEE